MKSALHNMFYGQLEIYIPDHACEEALTDLEVYFEQVDKTMGRDFGERMRDVEFTLSQVEGFTYFSRGFQLAVQLFTEK